jgi:hypothetical protein
MVVAGLLTSSVEKIFMVGIILQISTRRAMKMSMVVPALQASTRKEETRPVGTDKRYFYLFRCLISQR